MFQYESLINVVKCLVLNQKLARSHFFLSPYVCLRHTQREIEREEEEEAVGYREGQNTGISVDKFG